MFVLPALAILVNASNSTFDTSHIAVRLTTGDMQMPMLSRSDGRGFLYLQEVPRACLLGCVSSGPDYFGRDDRNKPSSGRNGRDRERSGERVTRREQRGDRGRSRRIEGSRERGTRGGSDACFRRSASSERSSRATQPDEKRPSRWGNTVAVHESNTHGIDHRNGGVYGPGMSISIFENTIKFEVHPLILLLGVLRPVSFTCVSTLNPVLHPQTHWCAVACSCLCCFSHLYRGNCSLQCMLAEVWYTLLACRCLTLPRACAQTTQSASEVTCTYPQNHQL